MTALASLPGRWLRERFKQPKPVRAPGAYDGITARQAARLGFEAVYLSGGGSSALYGLPDMAILSRAELVAQARLLNAASGLPLIADADTGFGGLPSLRRTIQELEGCGAAAIHIEDQPHERRCGFMGPLPCVPIDEMVLRLQAARNVATDAVIVARTESLLTGDLDDTLRRIKAYEEGGAEMIKVNGIGTLDQLARVAEVTTVPILHNMSSSDLSPDVTDEEAARFRVKVVIYPIHAHRAAAQAAKRYLTLLKNNQPLPKDLMMPFREFFELAGFDEAEAWEKSILS